jgi:hypothetical protein
MPLSITAGGMGAAETVSQARQAYCGRILTMHEEARRLYIQLLADVLAELDEILAALAAGARLRLVAMLDARQVLGQRLTTGTGTRRARDAGRRHTFLVLGQFGFGRRQIGGQGFLEQVALLRRQGFAAGTESHPAQGANSRARAWFLVWAA